MKRILVLLCICLLLPTATLLAQSLTGSITGSVTDEQGAVIPGAAVTATHTATNTTYEATTGAVGKFTLPTIRLGRYKVAIEMAGFRRGVVENVLVEVGQTATVNITLLVGAVTEEVIVESGEAQQIINTANAELGAVVDEQRVLDLPLNGRNAVELALLQAGVAFERNADGAGARLSVHGQRDNTFNISLNGIDVQDQISRVSSVKLDFPLLALAAENLQELQVVTGVGSAELSRGGAQVNAVTRAGGNDWHGSVFEFHRNNKFSANTFFNNTLGLPTPDLIRNQFGGRLGGPIVEDKVFFFFGYQQTRQTRGIPVQRLVYTQEARQGIFRYDDGGTIRSVNLLNCGGDLAADPTAILGRDCVAGNYNLATSIVSAGLLTPDPFIMNQIFDPSVVPLPNDFSFGDGLNTAGFRFNAKSLITEHLPSFRLDYKVNDTHSLYGTYNFTDRIIEGDFINDREPRFPGPGSLGNRITQAQGISLAVTSVLSPTIINEARWGFLDGDNLFEVVQPFATPFLIDFNLNHPDSGRFIYDNDNQTEGRTTKTFNVRDVVSWVRGNHVFKFGGEMRRRYVNFWSADGVNPFGEIDFNDGDNPPGFSSGNLQAMAGGATGPTSTEREIAEDLINDLIGAIGDVERRYNVSSITDTGFDVTAIERRILLGREVDLFFNDTWQVLPKLTLNLGLRWEYAGPITETQGLVLDLQNFEDVFGISGRQGLFNPGVFAGHGCDTSIFTGDLNNLAIATPTTQNALDLINGCATRFVPGSSSNGRPLWKNDNNNFGPVIGLAWDPWGDGKTLVLRAGGRITYLQDAFGIVERNLDDNEGLVVNQTCNPIDLQCQNNPLFLRDLIGAGTPESPAGGTPIAPVPTLVLPAFRSILDSSSMDFRTFDRNLETPYYTEWMLGIQREIMRDTALEIRYVGNHGVKLRNLVDHNEYNITSVDPNTGQNFLNSFLIAQANLACNRAVGAGSNFRDLGNSADPLCTALPSAGLLGANPLMDVLIAGDASRLGTTSGLRSALDRGEVGEFLDELTIDRTSRPSSGEARIRGGSWWGAVLRGDLPANFFRANPFVMAARGVTNNGFSTYHGLEIEVRRRFSDGFTVQANYTYGKSIADAGDSLGSTLFTQKPSPLRNPRSTIREIAPRHQFNANWLYELPLGEGRALSSENTFLKKLLGGWKMSGLIKQRSGIPISITSGRGSFLAASESDDNTVNLSQPLSAAELRALTGRRDLNGGVVWLDPCLSVNSGAACTLPGAIQGLFTYPNPGELGKLKQTPIFGPTRFQLDFGLFKTTPIGEGMDLEFRWEVFNATNKPNFDVPETNIRDTNFGRILDVVTDPRLMQFVLKINF